MKIGGGGLQSQAAQDVLNIKQAEQARLKISVDEELVRGQQRVGPELNKPVLNPNQSAELSNYLRSKEMSGPEKKRKRDRLKEKGDHGTEKTGLNGRYASYAKGSILDEYK